MQPAPSQFMPRGSLGGCALLLRSQGDGVGRGVAAAVGDGDHDLVDSELLDGVARPAADADDWPAGGIIAHLDVAPTDAATPAGADGFEDCFLGGPAAGVVLRRGLARLAVADFQRCIDAIDEQLSVPLDHLRDSQAFDDVGADADDMQRRVSVFAHVRDSLTILKSISRPRENLATEGTEDTEDKIRQAS